MSFPDNTMVKNSPANAEYMGSIPGSERPPGKGNGNLLQFSYLGKPMDRGAWQSTVHGSSLSFIISWNLLKLMSIELVKPSNHLILCRLLLQPSIFPSIRIFSNELGSLHQMANVLGLQLQHWSYLEGLISFRIDWFDLLLYRNSFVIHTCRY